MVDEGLCAVIDAAIAGDDAAWASLQANYDRVVWSTIAQFGLASIDRIEIRDEVWTTLHEQMSRLAHRDALPGWLRTTTSRLCINRRRGQRREVLHGELANDAVDHRTPESALLNAEQVRVARLALRQMSPRCQRLLIRLVEHDDDYRTLAAIIGVAPGSVGSLKYRCISQLRTQFFALMGEDS